MKIFFALLLPVLLAGQSAMLEIRLEDEGTAYAPGSRSPGLGILVRDELSRPVQDAVVTVKLPLDGAGGAFANGLTTEVVKTGSDGRAETSGVRWGRTAGNVEVKITAVKGTLRAGTVAAIQVAGAEGSIAVASRSAAPRVVRGKSRKKWVILGLIAAGAAGAGFASGWASGKTAAGGGTNPASGIQIGMPDISVGKP